MAAEAKGGEASPRPHLRRYFALDAFRGLAAVAVAIFHFRWTHPELSTCGIFERLVNLLDFFFVLGGFVLAHVYLAKLQPLGHFVWRRLARLYPLHVFALVMFALLQLGKLLAESAGFATRHAAFEGMNALNFVDSLLLLQSTGLLWHEISWNYPSWTVSTELFAAAIVYGLAIRFGQRALAPICVAIVVASAIYMFVFTVEPRDYGPDALIRTLYGLALGYLLYRLHTRFEIIRGPVWGTIAEVLAIAFVLLLVRSPATRPYWYLVTLGLAVVIYVFASEQGLISSAFRKLRLHHLGTASYSIYLNHALIGIIFSKLYLTVAPNLGIVGAVSVAVYVPTFVLVLIVYSGFTLRYIEKPGHALMMRVRSLVLALIRPPQPSPVYLARLERVLAPAGSHPSSSRPAASSGVKVPASTASAS